MALIQSLSGAAGEKAAWIPKIWADFTQIQTEVEIKWSESHP